MPYPPKIPRADMITRYYAGATTAELAALYGVNRSTIYKRMAAWGMPLRDDRYDATHLRVDPHVEAHAGNLRLAGHTWAQIAAATGLSKSGARKAALRWLDENGRAEGVAS